MKKLLPLFLACLPLSSCFRMYDHADYVALYVLSQKSVNSINVNLRSYSLFFGKIVEAYYADTASGCATSNFDSLQTYSGIIQAQITEAMGAINVMEELDTDLPLKKLMLNNLSGCSNIVVKGNSIAEKICIRSAVAEIRATAEEVLKYGRNLQEEEFERARMVNEFAVKHDFTEKEKRLGDPSE